MPSLINDPYISVEIEPEEIATIAAQVQELLTNDFNLDVKLLPNPHVSISYILGNVDMELIESAAKEIVEAPFKVKVVGFAALPSEFYNGTIIALKLQHNEDFLYSQEQVASVVCSESNQVKIKQFDNGGFKAHISLCLIQNLSEEDVELLPQWLEIALDRSNREIYGKKFCVYNTKREKVLETAFKK